LGGGRIPVGFAPFVELPGLDATHGTTDHGAAHSTAGAGAASRLPVRGSEKEGSTWKGDAGFVAVVAGLFALLVLVRFPDVLHGALIDTDSYMRLVRVRRLAESGGWFDITIPRSNAPFGSTLHWTRPVDVLLLAGAWLTEAFFGFDRALHLSGVLLSPVLLTAICFATAWSVRPLAGSRVRRYTMLAVLAQVGIMSYALPGRADHNMLILLAFVAMLGSAMRLLLEPDVRWASWATGAWAAFGLWVSTEFLAPLFVLLLTLLVLWVWMGESIVGRARSASLGLLVVTVVAVVVERPPTALLVAEYDRISVVHAFVAALVAGFWILAASTRASRLDALGRGVFAAVGTLLAAALLIAIYPRFLGGPMVDVHPDLKRTWLPFLTEFRPYLSPTSLSGVGRMLAYLGQAFLALGVVAYGLRRDRGTPLTGVWVLLGVALALFIPLGVRWIRFVTYAEMLGVIGTMFLLARALGRMEGRLSGFRLAATRALASVSLLVGPVLLGAGVMALGGESRQAVREAAATQTRTCPVDRLVSALDEPALGDRPRIVLAHVDLGPVLLYRTRHAVVATPYHRNWQGILDWQRIMAARDPDQARRMILERGVDLVVACGAEPPARAGEAAGAPTFAELLYSGRAPDWLHPLDVAGAGEALRIYEVSPAPQAGEWPTPDGAAARKTLIG
jgi:hypothetical protein